LLQKDAAFASLRGVYGTVVHLRLCLPCLPSSPHAHTLSLAARSGRARRKVAARRRSRAASLARRADTPSKRRGVVRFARNLHGEEQDEVRDDVRDVFRREAV
jgi:hypothetical protein